MKDEVVSFEVAKLAQEKKFFSEPKEHGKVYGPWYNERGEYLGRTDIDKEGIVINFKSYGKDYKDHMLKSYYAPTQNLVQTWLREKYNIHVEVTVEQIVNNLTVYKAEVIREDKDDPKAGFLRQSRISGLTDRTEILDLGLQRGLELV